MSEPTIDEIILEIRKAERGMWDSSTSDVLETHRKKLDNAKALIEKLYIKRSEVKSLLPDKMTMEDGLDKGWVDQEYVAFNQAITLMEQSLIKEVLTAYENPPKSK